MGLLTKAPKVPSQQAVFGRQAPQKAVMRAALAGDANAL